MTIDIDNLPDSILKSLDRIPHITSSDIPDIGLYMDQVLSLLNDALKKTTRDPASDKIMTKTMINNYTKNDLLPPPQKKKYSREQIMLLIFIYYFKGVMSIGDIHTLLDPIEHGYINSEDKSSDNTTEIQLSEIYNRCFSMVDSLLEDVKTGILNEFEKSSGLFEDASDKDRQYLNRFAFICSLCFDVYTKKLLISKIIDSIDKSPRG